MVTYRGRGGFAETICEKAVALEQDRIDGNFAVNFYRTNNEHMEGCVELLASRQAPLAVSRTVRLGISTRVFYTEGLSTLFHELGHAQGQNHREAIDYTYSRLHELSGMKFMHSNLSIMGMAVIDLLISEGIDNAAVHAPQPVMIDLKRKGRQRVMEVCGPYEHVLPYLDARPDAKIFDGDRKPITDKTGSAPWEKLCSPMGCILVIPM